MKELDELLKQEIEIERDEIKIDRYDIEVTLVQPSIQSIVEDLDIGEIYIPEFQRNFRWSLEKASKLIESFLLGLPVPPIFVYKDPDERFVVIDGQQRLLSLYFFIRKGIFPSEDNDLNFSSIKGLKNLKIKKGKPFKLKGVKSEWEGKKFIELKENDKRFLLKTPIWIISIRQIKPEKDLSSSFYIFERLNTGGETLSPMEIRKALYYGDFYKLLEEINKDKNWRNTLGMPKPHKKLMDIEILLRILYLSVNWRNYKEPMKERLNEFMKNKRFLSKEELNTLKKQLKTLFELVNQAIVNYEKNKNDKAFSLKRKRLNLSFLDSFMGISLQYLAFLNKKNILEIYKYLKESRDFIQIINKHRVSTDTKSVKERFKFVEEVFRSMLNK